MEIETNELVGCQRVTQSIVPYFSQILTKSSLNLRNNSDQT